MKIIPKILILLSFAVFIVPATTHASYNIETSFICPDPGNVDMAVYLADEIDSRIQDQNPENTWSLFSMRDGNIPASNWQRNQSVWTNQGSKKFDFTGVSPLNSDLLFGKAGTLISPRHIVFASHFYISEGAQIVFIDNDNNPVQRTVKKIARIEGDAIMGVLDEDVPETITYYPVVSSDEFSSKIEKSERYVYDLPSRINVWATGPIPMIVLNQEDQVIVHDLVSSGKDGVGHQDYNWLLDERNIPISSIGDMSIYLNNPKVEKRKEFSRALRMGDSGDAGFIAIDGQLILLLTHAGTTSGPSYGDLISKMNTVMDELDLSAEIIGENYDVTTYDLSCFKDFVINKKPVFADNLPVEINLYEATTTLPQVVFDFGATDPDGDLFEYTFSLPNEFKSGLTTLSSSGEIVYSGALNFETIQTKEMYKEMLDYAIEDPDQVFLMNEEEKLKYKEQISKSVARTVSAFVIDNDEFPAKNGLSRWINFYNVEESPVFESDSYSFTTNKNSPNGTVVGSVIASDEDYDEVVYYSIESGNVGEAFKISSTTGEIVVNNSSALNLSNNFNLVVMASSTNNLLIPDMFGVENHKTVEVKIGFGALQVQSSVSSGGGGGGGGGSSKKIEVKQTIAPVVNKNTNNVPNATLASAQINIITPSVKLSFPRSLTIGSMGEDVKALQQFLNSKGFTVSLVGPGSSGNESTYFGLKTRLALANFQSSVGINPAIGYFGPITRKYILEH